MFPLQKSEHTKKKLCKKTHIARLDSSIFSNRKSKTVSQFLRFHTSILAKEIVPDQTRATNRNYIPPTALQKGQGTCWNWTKHISSLNWSRNLRQTKISSSFWQHQIRPPFKGHNQPTNQPTQPSCDRHVGSERRSGEQRWVRWVRMQECKIWTSWVSVNLEYLEYIWL